MKPNKQLSRTILASSVATVMAFSSTLALAEAEQKSKIRTYTDATTGEFRVAPKLLSEMTEQEKAALTKEEKKTLEQIEAQLNKEKKEMNK